ncbi:MAG: hypothetical protein Q8N31_01540, partial [Reyranella sp.]|nr:hypothetical protein [Reyranella sp.]
MKRIPPTGMPVNLQAIARALGGRVRRDHVVAPGPGEKKRDRSLSVWISGDDIRVHSHRDMDWRELQDYVRSRCGIPKWQPKAKAPPKVPLYVRIMFLSETLKICRNRERITFEQFVLLLNDLRLTGATGRAMAYAREFGFTAADIERCMQITPQGFTADQRAEIFDLLYAERQALGLRRTGSVDVDKAGRERARCARRNRNRRIKRAQAKKAGTNRANDPHPHLTG